ncbi:cation-independent mannose-6-phosphate receptor-like isoform X2 [Uloborus diversus]|uniref:cation-independent mannose-6-phosphate receptor-like isoform X2 n=1 Tax=Uloborus diversus TaxID=327109 RepID=UPI0024092199|nr:cation-independent mannose-6-phosphate receptor-like isoform X2 [Uloborus diversus]
MSVFISFSSVILLCLFRTVCPSCVFQSGKYDLSALDWPEAWQATGPSINGTNYRYHISLCHPVNLTDGCSNSSVCQVTGKKSVSYGNAVATENDAAFADNLDGGFSIYLHTRETCGNGGVHRAVINFACGPHLGAPELILRSDCQVNFYWRTYLACPKKPAARQVPCYVIDGAGDKRDLSRLISKEGGHSVDVPNAGYDLVINVCSEIGTEVGCPANSAACRMAGSERLSFGELKDRVRIDPEGLVLTYETGESARPPAGCLLRPKTRVLFKCPPRGRGRPPRLISDSNCQYEVEWETEYACPENLLKGNFKTCQFSMEAHGIEIDLSPLKKKVVHDIAGNGTDTTFSLSVCGGLGDYACAGKHWKSTAVCMTNGTSKIVGTTDGADLLYADGEVILAYPKGSSCEDGVEETSVINFVCDPAAINDGEGEPHHIISSHCAHVFEWRTKHACLKKPFDTPCSVTFGKKKVSLRKLLLPDGESWEAVDRRDSPHGDGSEFYYINVCGFVSNLSNLCGAGSSACVAHSNGNFTNLGNFTSPPVYDVSSNSVRLTYTGGSSCGNGKFWQSEINFVCRPGHINSEPVLVRVDDRKCKYEFEWHTAEACPRGTIEGSDCKVYDANLGINYDLTPLRSKSYRVDTDSSLFYLGVCQSAQNSPCNGTDFGVCQVDKTNNTSWKLGEPSSELTYLDGVVNLTYMNGDPYYDANHTARMSIIIFICSYEAGNGNPQFVEEINFASIFHWYTSLVCAHSVVTECLVHDPATHLLYDLGGLSLSQQHWVTVINDDGKERQVYLNVCRSLAVSIGCDSNAAACMVEPTPEGDKVVVPNLGQAVRPPVLASPGHLSLSYVNGSPCQAYGANVTYSTIIHFLCPDEDHTKSGLKFLSKLGTCIYTFVWTTKAACPTGTLRSVDDCRLTDPESGYTFDLTSLRQEKEPYTVSSASGTFKLNICGSVVQGCSGSKNVSVCKVDGDKTEELAVSNSYALSYSTMQDLTLTYKSGDIPNRVAIKFPCSNTSDGSPKFLREEDGHYTFEMKTPLSCIPAEFDCNIVDDMGNEYDLSPLARYADSNWEVNIQQPEYAHLRYHINFCRPLNRRQDYRCPGGSSMACQTDLTHPERDGVDLGSQMSRPMVNKETVVVRYVNGSYCPNGQFRRSTTINLFCSDEEKPLKFIGETAECEYVFSMDTPVACSIQSSRGKNCMVKDPLFGYMFDLSPLKSKNDNYKISVGEYNYTFNVCDGLNGFQKFPQCSNSSICLTKPSDPTFAKSLGRLSDVLMYRKGIITLKYDSGSGDCHGQHNRSTIITFICHHAHEAKDGPIFIEESQDCSYLFEWPTVHACPTFDVIDCSVTDKNGLTYDLSHLSLPNTNYYIKYGGSSDKMFVINVCRSIVHSPDSLCPYASAACLLDSSLPDQPLDLGRVSRGPYVEDGKVKLTYSTGDLCKDGDSRSASFMQTVIEFSCDETALDSVPEFVGKDGCTYYFDWSTARACPTKTPRGRGDCTVEDPATGHVFNFTALRDHGSFKTRKGSHEYHVSVCGGGKDTSPCGLGSAMCQEELSGGKRHWSGGAPNGNLTLDDGILLLNYTGGDPCHQGRFQRNTLIEFRCGSGLGEPKLLYESQDCTYFFSWKTELACRTAVHCAVKNGSSYYDLGQLAEMYHEASSTLLNDGASYYVSLCSSLPRLPDASCPPGASICRVTNHAAAAPTVESLGKIDRPPFVDFMGHATTIYTNGSACSKNPSRTNSARIIFLCDPLAGAGEPVLLDDDYDECLFIFQWKTSLVCPEKPEVPPSFTSCNYTDSGRGIHFDLSPLKRSGSHPYYEVPDADKRNASFLVNVCSTLEDSGVPHCATSGVCAREGAASLGYGVASSQKFSYDGRRLRLTFYDGDDCPSGLNGKRTSEIFFTCDPTAGNGEPVLHKKYTCLAVFMWKTSLVCQNLQQQCAFDVGGVHYDFNLLSSLSHNWNASDGKNIFWINMCRGIQPTRLASGCSRAAAVCMVDPQGFHTSLGLVQSMKVKSINSTAILLTFEGGSKRACSPIRSESELRATTRLFMKCGTTLGGPRLFSGPDSECFYDFVWESSLACEDKAEEVMLEDDGMIIDKRLGHGFDIHDILNHTFSVPGTSSSDQYLYQINLSGVKGGVSDPTDPCALAAVCQTKPNTTFLRDIGSVDTRTFVIRGSELHMSFVSHTRPCGKNSSKNVTTLINVQCVSAAGIGSPTFLYESGNCDYIFEWETIVMCPDFHRRKPDPVPGHRTDPIPQEAGSSHTAEIVVGVLFAMVAVMAIAFVLLKAERRAILSSRVRSMFGRVSVPYFRYKRGDILTELQSDF